VYISALENAKNESLRRNRFYNILFGVLKNKYRYINIPHTKSWWKYITYILSFLYTYNGDQFCPYDVDVAKNLDWSIRTREKYADHYYSSIIDYIILYLYYYIINNFCDCILHICVTTSSSCLRVRCDIKRVNLINWNVVLDIMILHLPL